jgi:hypothetical protein
MALKEKKQFCNRLRDKTAISSGLKILIIIACNDQSETCHLVLLLFYFYTGLMLKPNFTSHISAAFSSLQDAS